MPVHILWTDGSISPSSLYPQCMFSLIFHPSFFLSISSTWLFMHTHRFTTVYIFHIHAISGLATVKFCFKILTPQLTLCLKRRAWCKLTDQNYPIPYYPLQFDNCMCLFLNSHYYYLTWTFLKKTTRNNFRETLIFLTQYNRLLGNN